MQSQSFSRPMSNSSSRASPYALVLVLSLTAVVLLLVLVRAYPTAMWGGPEAPSNQFAAARASALLKEILPEQVPHPVGTKQNEIVAQRIVEKLEALGYSVEEQSTISCYSESGASTTCTPVHNLLSRLPGQVNGPALMLVTHYDSVGAGPGASDDGSGVATLLEIARILKNDSPLRNTVIFLFTDGEEAWLMGARAFQQEHPLAKEIGAVVNLEARGTRGLSMMFETSENNAWLIDAYASSVDRPSTSSLFFEVYKLMPNDTDLTIFREAGIPSLNFAFIDNGEYYHTPLDNLHNLSLGSLQHQGETILALARALAMHDLANPPRGNAVYTDILGYGLIKWPEAMTIPLVMLSLLLLVASAVILIWKGNLQKRELLWGFLAAFLAVLLPILLGVALTMLISTVAGNPNPWFAYPSPTRFSLWIGALLCAALLGAAFTHRAGLWGLALGVWFLWTFFALVLTFTLTGVSVVFLCPSLFAALLLAMVSVTPLRGSTWSVQIAMILSALFAEAIWMNLALGFENALGFETSPAITLALGMVASTLLPLFSLPEGHTRLRQWIIVGAASLTLISTAVAMLVPSYSSDYPQRLNIFHYEDRDNGTSFYISEYYKEGIPPAMEQVAKFEKKQILPWSDDQYLVTPAPPNSEPAPELEVLSDQMIGAEREVRVRLRSPRGAQLFDMLVPIDQLASISVAGKEYPVEIEDSENGFYNFYCFGSECSGIELTLRLIGAMSVKVRLIDYTYGLSNFDSELVKARNSSYAIPYSDGDETILSRSVDL